MKVSILKHVDFENPGYYLEYFVKKEYEVTIHNLYEGDKPDDNADIILVLGGPMNIYEEEIYPFLKDEKEYISKSIKEGKKVIGICLGSQIIADVLGSKVYKNKYREIGWFPILKSQNGIMGFLPDIATVFHWHSDTCDLPVGAKALYSSDATKIQAFQYDSNVLAMQFHLEMDEDSIGNLVHQMARDLDNSLYVMTKEEIINQCKVYSYSNKQILHNILKYFLS